jgi:3-oxoacyl-[acyl-carrier protein] reductase
MELGLEGRSVLVAAGSKGIGKATALAFLREGARVTICARDGAGLARAHDELLAATGGQMLAIEADVTNVKQLESLVESARRAHGDVEILVNNAGGPPAGDHTTITDTHWEDSFRLTLQSAVRLTNLVLPAMKSVGWGRVINISSYSVKQPLDNMLLSNSLRLGALGWAKTLATEVAPNGILVNTVCPGWTQTQRVTDLLQQRAVANGTSLDAAREAIVSDIPLGRMGQADEVANLILFLASQAASYLTGVAIPVDGGASRAF